MVSLNWVTAILEDSVSQLQYFLPRVWVLRYVQTKSRKMKDFRDLGVVLCIGCWRGSITKTRGRFRNSINSDGKHFELEVHDEKSRYARPRCTMQRMTHATQGEHIIVDLIRLSSQVQGLASQLQRFNVPQNWHLPLFKYILHGVAFFPGFWLSDYVWCRSRMQHRPSQNSMKDKRWPGNEAQKNWTWHTSTMMHRYERAQTDNYSVIKKP